MAYETTFDPNISSTDLINQGSPVVSGVTTAGTNSNAAAYNGATPPGAGGFTGIYDGVASSKTFNGSVNNVTNDTFFSSGDLGAATAPSITYNFASPQSIGSIRSIEGWTDTSTFSNQKDQVFLNGSATPFYSVSYLPNPASNNTLNGGTGVGTSPHATQVLLTDTTGTLASGVTSIKFVFQANGGTGQVVREFDVNAVPEPASLSLLGLGAFGLLRRRCRAR